MHNSVVRPALSSFSSNRASGESAFDVVIDYVGRRYRLDLHQYRPRFLDRRISSRMQARHVVSYAAYVDLLREDPAEYGALLDALSINVSYFMRDQVAFDALKEQVLAPLLRECARARGRRLAIWSAGCSKGEEPYSIAMLLADSIGLSCPDWRVSLHATDVNLAALEEAKVGRYAEESLRTTDARHVVRYFQRVGQAYRLDPDIKRMVTWAHQDILAPPLLSKYDLILCRNVLIYYVHDRQASIVEHLVNHLAPGGYLMLGMTEMLPRSQSDRLLPVNAKCRLYRLR